MGDAHQGHGSTLYWGPNVDKSSSADRTVGLFNPKSQVTLYLRDLFKKKTFLKRAGVNKPLAGFHLAVKHQHPN